MTINKISSSQWSFYPANGSVIYIYLIKNILTVKIGGANSATLLTRKIDERKQTTESEIITILNNLGLL